MSARWLLAGLLVAVVIAAAVVAWHVTGPSLDVSVRRVVAPTSVTGCQTAIRGGLGYNEDETRCRQELRTVWVSVAVRNTGHRTAADFSCTLTAATSFGGATVDLPRPGGVPGVAITPGQERTWVTWTGLSASANVQSLHATCSVITNRPV